MIHNKYYEVMKPFLKDYFGHVYGRELIGKVNVSQKNIALTLNELEDSGILKSKTKAGVKYFLLNEQNPLMRRYVVILEIMHSIEFLQKYERIKHMIDKIEKKPQILCVIGGYARETENKPADLDLFMVGDTDEEYLKELGGMYNLEIHPLKLSKRDFVDSIKKDNEFIKEVILNHVILWGYDEFVNLVTEQKW